MSEVKYKLKDGLTGGMFSSCKWDVSEWSEAQKTLWQGAMFELGYVWARAGQNVDNLNKRYYYTNNPYMCYSECGRNYFEQQTNKQKYFSDVFDVVGEEEETSTDDVLIFNKSVDTEEELLAKVGLSPKETTEWTNKHYDNYYTLTDEDIKEGKIRVDAYFVNRMWKLNALDDTGCAFHSLKTFARMGNNKNSLERELNALNGQLKAWARMNGVVLK